MGNRGRFASATTTGGVEPATPAPHSGDLDASVIRAAGTLMARWGVTKTTVADIATEAGCSRATVYHAFPGGKQEILRALGRAELDLFFDDLVERVDVADDLEHALVDLLTSAARTLEDHEGFQFMLEHEPGLVLPYLGFHRIDRLYRLARRRLSPHFERFVGDRAPWAVEWTTRVALSYVFQPSPALDLTDPTDARHLVRSYLLPGLTPQFATIPA